MESCGEITIGMSVDRYKMHDIEIVVDKIVMDQADLKRLKNSVGTAMKHGRGRDDGKRLRI